MQCSGSFESHIVQQQPPALLDVFDLPELEVLAAEAAPDWLPLGLVWADPLFAESATAANASANAHTIRDRFMLFSRCLYFPRPPLTPAQTLSWFSEASLWSIERSEDGCQTNRRQI